MARCPDCKAKIDNSIKECPYCGKEVIPASFLETIPTKTSTWQKIVIIVSIIILIAIGFTFMGAEKREDTAAQNIFNEPVSQLVASAALHTGLSHVYGMPGHTLDADPKSAYVSVQFPKGPLSARQAQNYAIALGGMLARTYVDKGYMPRNITVAVYSGMPDGKVIYYGKAWYDGNKDQIHWLPETY